MGQRQILKLGFWATLGLFLTLYSGLDNIALGRETMVPNKQMIIIQLRDHLTMLTHIIGERSVKRPDNHDRLSMESA